MKRYKNLSRPKKAALNLTLVAVLLFALWAYFGYPLPTTEMEFRRMERQNLLPKSEILLLSEKEDGAFVPVEGPELILNGRWAVGRHEETAVMACLGRGIWDIPMKSDGPTVLPLACERVWGDAYVYWVEEGPIPAEEGGGYRYTHHNFTPLLLLDVPEETARVELRARDNQGTAHDGEGWNLGDGIWLVGLTMYNGLSNRSVWFDGCAYTLRLYDTAGNVALEQEGTISKI